MNLKKIFLGSTLALSLGLGLAACGNDESSTTKTTSKDTTPSTVEPTTPASTGSNETTTQKKELKEAKFYMVGDSTMCSFADAYYLPRYGYGTQMGTYFDEKLTMVNLAMSGRSSKSFLTEENYAALDSIKEGDYLLIGFGHNDEKNDDVTRYSAPTLDAKDIEGSLQYNLYHKYMKKALDKGATPILASPIVRLDATNTYTGSSGHVTGTGDYAACIKDLAEDTNTAFVDLTKITRELYESLTYDTAIKFHAVTQAKKDGDTLVPDYNTVDKTHINKYGAAQIAYEFANAIKKTDCSLKDYVKDSIQAPTNRVYLNSVNPDYVYTPYTPINKATFKAEASGSTFTTTPADIMYDSKAVGYGWLGTVFGECGSTTYGYKATESAGTYTIGQDQTAAGKAAGKIASANDGFAFLFSQLDSSLNFKCTATLKITAIGKDANNQSCVGLTLRDDCYEPNKTNVITNYVATGALGAFNASASRKANWSRETAKLNSADEIAALAVNDTLECSIERIGQVVNCSTTYKGTTYTKTYTDFDFTSVDNKYMYIGVIANRGVVCETTDLALNITGYAIAA